MNRIAVLSDAHGNLPALEAVLDDVAEFHPDKVIYAGDFLRGPFPNETIELLRRVDAAMIIGNDDQHTLRYRSGRCPAEWHTRKQYAIVRWTAAQLTRANYEFLCRLPDQQIIHPTTGVEAIRVVHGSPRSQSESLDPDRDSALINEALNWFSEPIMICGHTHRQWQFRNNGKQIINPGAVAGTQIGPYAQYARLTSVRTGWDVEMRTLPYNFDCLKSAFEQRGLLEAGGPMARGYLLSMQTGYDYMMAFLHHAYALATKQGIGKSQVLPDEIWDYADQTFSWDLPEKHDLFPEA